MPRAKQKATRQIQPSDRWDMTRQIMGMCLVHQGVDSQQRPVELAESLMTAHPRSAFRLEVKHLLQWPSPALWHELGKAVQQVLQLAIAYECQGLEWNFPGVLSDMTDELMHVTEPGGREQQLHEFLRHIIAANDEAEAQAKAKAKTKAQARGAIKVKAQPAAKTKAATVAKVKVQNRAAAKTGSKAKP